MSPQNGRKNNTQRKAYLISTKWAQGCSGKKKETTKYQENRCLRWIVAESLVEMSRCIEDVYKLAADSQETPTNKASAFRSKNITFHTNVQSVGDGATHATQHAPTTALHHKSSPSDF